jgi:hypothetical protein
LCRAAPVAGKRNWAELAGWIPIPEWTGLHDFPRDARVARGLLTCFNASECLSRQGETYAGPVRKCHQSSGSGSLFSRVLSRLHDQASRGCHPISCRRCLALNLYTGIKRDTKDLDIFVRPEDCPAALRLWSQAGYETEMVFEHWLAKAYSDGAFVDLIFSSGNGIARVDDSWFRHAISAEVLGIQVSVCPVEETIWSKSFVMERERYDGADIAHLLRACGPQIDWRASPRSSGPGWEPAPQSPGFILLYLPP